MAPLFDGEIDKDESLEFLEDRVKAAQLQDAIYQRITRKLEDGDRKDHELTLADYEIRNRALFVQSRLWVLESIRTEVIAAVHNTPVTGHPRLAKTLYHLKKLYY